MFLIKSTTASDTYTLSLHDALPISEIEALDLTRRDIDVVGTVEVVPVGTAQEPVPLGKDLQHALAAEHGVRVEERLLDAEDQVLLAEPRIVLNVEALGHRVQLRDGFPLQLCDVHVCFGSVGAKAGKPRIWGNDALLVGVWESGDGCRSYPRPLARLRQGRVWT